MMGNVAVVVVSLFGHRDSKELTGSWFWRCFGFGNSQIVFRKPNLGLRAAEFPGAVCGCFLVKAQRLGANDRDVCGCRIPLVAPLWVSTLRYGSD
jgi:hypothetical protein